STVQTNGLTSWSTSGRGNGTYGYHVQACNVGGCGPWSAVGNTTVLLPPPAPASISVPASSSGSFTVTWAASATATSYTLQQSVNGGGWTTVYSNAANGTTLNEAATGSYTLRVQACNSSGCSAYTASNPVAVTVPPASAPSLSVPASSTNGSYTVSWGGVSGATSYTLQEQVNGGGWTTVQTNGNTSWGTSGRGNGTYGYHVQACNVGGCGPWSAVASTTVLLVPPVPASITVPVTSNGPIAISWAASATATIYGLDQSINGGAWAQVYANSATSTTVTAGSSGSYSFRAYACNASGCNGYATSGAVAVTLPPASAPSLSVPASSNNGSYTVSWGAVSAATSYTLREQVNGGAWTTVQANGNTSWSTSGRSDGTYGYQVQACNGGGCGPWSGVGSISVALVPVPPTNPIMIDTVAPKSESYLGQWDPVGNATRYELMRTDSSFVFYSGTATSYPLGSGPVGYELPYGVELRACNNAGCSAWEYLQLQ
ncbi:fibronectin type III domain-containing protein, partial [Rhodanobacter sp. OK091]|uniref:fibronectin type III domain-containing protein n=1 Tax=Rhodanobacter sp. OK091 TaxID=1881037 RepID=UPI00091E7A5B